MVKAFALYEQKDGKLKKLHSGSHDSFRIFRDFLEQPESGQNPLVLLSGSEDELLKLLTTEEARRKGLIFKFPRP